MSLDLQSGMLNVVGADLSLPAIGFNVVITNSLNEVGFTSPRTAVFGNPPPGDQVMLTTRNSQSGDLSLQPPQFPSQNQDELQTSFLNPNGKIAYAILQEQGAPGSDDDPIVFRTYQRLSDGSFSQLSETHIDDSHEFLCPHYRFSGIMHADIDYLVVNEATGCDPQGGSSLQLWQLSPTGDVVQNQIPVSGSNYDNVVEGWNQNVLIDIGEMNVNAGNSSFNLYVYRVAGGQLQKIAMCDASIRPDCPDFISFAVSSSKTYAYGLTLANKPGTSELWLIRWNESSGEVIFTDLGVVEAYNDKLFVDPSGQFLLVAGNDAKQVHVYKIDPSTGNLTEVPGSPFAAPGTIVDLAFVRQP